MKILRIAVFNARTDQLTIPFSIGHQEELVVISETKLVLAQALFNPRLNESVVQFAFNNKYFYLSKRDAQLYIFVTERAVQFCLNTIFKYVMQNACSTSSAWPAFVTQTEAMYKKQIEDNEEFKTKAHAIQKNIEKTRSVLCDDVLKMQERQEKISCILEKTERLKECTRTFKTRAIILYKKPIPISEKISQLFCCFFMCYPKRTTELEEHPHSINRPT